MPALQVGDTVRAGMAVAQIPDMNSWEVAARIAELDRGHLAVGQKVDVHAIALHGRTFQGRLHTIGGTTGPPWDRRFDTRIAIEQPSRDLRPGMSTRLVITTAVMKNVLWLPAQAVFDSEGRKFVYVKTGDSFRQKDVAMVRRSESKVVIEGIAEGQMVALANPDELRTKQPAQKNGAMQAIPR
jgi:hypothetical protein